MAKESACITLTNTRTVLTECLDLLPNDETIAESDAAAGPAGLS